MEILVTGGAGFIGSHTCVELLNHGHSLVVIDDFSNSSPAALTAVRQLADGELVLHELDVRDAVAMDQVFAQHHIDAVIHFAAKKAVNESLQIPLEYYDINVGGTITLLQCMVRHNVRRLVFSSSCSIYGDQYTAPITEDDAPAPVSPYAWTKRICEQILADACARHDDLAVIALRYFNPVGAHPSGTLGEVPRGVPTNVMPHMMQVAAGIRDRLHVFGSDYPTPDGSPVRDYVHVMDLAEAHRVALDHLADQPGIQAFNLGTGVGISVLELVRAFEQSCGTQVPVSVVDRRAGDPTSAVADSSKVEKYWGWRTKLDVYDMCRDAWRFQQLHLRGYAE